MSLPYRFVAVLNKKIEPGKAMNALAHMTAGLASTFEDRAVLGCIDYKDKDGTSHIASRYPFIILRAKNSNQIRTLRNELQTHGIAFASFTDAMTVGGYQEQLIRSEQTPEVDLEYYGICSFGSTDTLSELTRKFSLWQ